MVPPFSLEKRIENTDVNVKFHTGDGLERFHRES